MFKKSPDKENQVDELERTIESHRIMSKRLSSELDNYGNEIKRFKKLNLKKPLLYAINGYKSIKDRIESIEVTRMRLVDVRTHLKYTPDTLSEKSFADVNNLIRDAELKLNRDNQQLQSISDLTSSSLSTISDEIDLTDNEIDSILKDLGVEDSTIERELSTEPAPEKVVYGNMPDIPEEIEEEISKEENEKSKIQEENL
ncbi:MAG: hypothetical protein ACTSQH_01000 [Candidatus Hodarchaeales archaeon]